MDLKILLEEAARKHGPRPAIIMGEKRLSYAELDASANRVANALLDMKVKKGDRVAMILSNTPEFDVVYFGVVKAGAIAVPLDTRYRLAELPHILGNCKPRVLVTESPIFEVLVPVLGQFDYIERVITTGKSSEKRFTTYAEIMAGGSARSPSVPISPEDPATISYSGGPAIHAHGALFTHRNLVTHVPISVEVFQQGHDDATMLFALPMYHVYGMNAGLFTPLHVGSRIVMVAGTGVSINTLFETIQKEKGTILHAVPYIYALAIKLAKKEGVKYDLSSLRLCVSGGAPLPVRVMQEFKQHYGQTIHDFYGMTESTCEIACQRAGTEVPVGSCGTPVDCFQVKIIDDRGRQLPTGRNGEIVIKGNTMKGYYNNAQATADVIKDGWLHTGDVGKFDKDGFLYITGRKKRMIILKGQNVYPGEIEEVLASHPAVAESRVIGVADALRGEVVRAYIRLKEGQAITEHELRRFCQDRMADYRVPRQVVFTKELPEAANAIARKRLFKDYLRCLAALPYNNPEEPAGF